MIYHQNDYPDTPYPFPNDEDGTLALAGCGVCSCCMVVEALTGQTFPPPEGAELALSCGARDLSGTEISVLAPAVCARFGLQYELTDDAGRVLQFLQEGRGLAVANVTGDREGHKGVFCYAGHFIVLAGAKGREIAVWDPWWENDGRRYDPFVEAGTVRVEGCTVYADIKTVAADCAGATPAYTLFRR